MTDKAQPVFTTDWTTSHASNWQKLLGHLEGQPARMLEIGCWEGRSSIHFVQNILTHSESKLVCIDPKPQDCFEPNLRAAEVRHRIEFHKSESQRIMVQFSDRQFDAAYIDGNHEAAAVLTDALAVLPKMKPGGVIIFDDYAHQSLPTRHVMPGVGIDCFLQVTAPHFVKEIFRGWQLAVRVA